MSGQLALADGQRGDGRAGGGVGDAAAERQMQVTLAGLRGCSRRWCRPTAMSDVGRSPNTTVVVARSFMCASRHWRSWSETLSRARASTRCVSVRSQLGWPAGSVVVVDEDTGRSGASATGRLGFKELVAEVGLGHVGLILALEVSRLARSSADWHQLIDLCALTGTLIADSDGIYSPADFNDRLLLGLKGTMSEAELHLIRARLNGGLRYKAHRGELRMHPARRF